LKKKNPEREGVGMRSHEFYSVAQIAKLLNLNEMTIYRLVKSGELSGYQLGRSIRFHRHDVEEFVSKRRVVALRKVTPQTRGPRLNRQTRSTCD
jgi:excisionase family DNA binding protein